MGGASVGKRLRYSVSECPFVKLEQHGGIAATGHHASCWRVRCKPEFLHTVAEVAVSTAVAFVPLAGFRGGVAKTTSGGAHVPEIAADEIALSLVIVQHRRQRRIGMSLRLALAKARAHRSGLRACGPIDLGNRSGKSGFRHMAESAGLISVHRKLFVEEQQFA